MIIVSILCILAPREISSISWADISQLLFGTAMYEDVQDLNYHYVSLTAIATISKLVSLIIGQILHLSEVSLSSILSTN